ncbi:MAG TPA: hypothetical protein DCL77_01665 [Prolixibacteraceae bacterium]|jgi:replicative DNA helicase|nr:hypothetical protein [Prolixibacteraceae bacterium]
MNKYSEFKVRPIGSVLTEAKKEVQESRAGRTRVLKTRWKSVNKMLLGGFYFGQTYLIAGASGHGKSYLVNMLLRDFANASINGTLPFQFKILHFGFEMSASAEILRRITSMTGISYTKLLSVENKLSDEQFESVEKSLVNLRNEEIYFVETPGSRFQIYETIKAFKAKFPDHELVVSVDHMLLVTPEPGEDEIQLQAEVSKLFIQIRKEFHTMNLLVSQLNDKIEGENRRDPSKPSLHYPTKTDLHGSKQGYQAADCVLVIHCPELLNLEYYGKENFPTRGLVALHQIKQRHGIAGFTLMRNNLESGTFEDWERPVISYSIP